MKTYKFKPRFIALITAACVLTGGFSIAKIDAVCGEKLLDEVQPRTDIPVYASVGVDMELEAAYVPPEPVSLGEYVISHYCVENYPHICNDGDSTYTASGTRSTPGRSIAADPNVLPYGTKVIINGHEYVVEDCGNAIQQKRIDIMVETHEEALQLGMKTAEVFLVME